PCAMPGWPCGAARWRDIRPDRKDGMDSTGPGASLPRNEGPGRNVRDLHFARRCGALRAGIASRPEAGGTSERGGTWLAGGESRLRAADARREDARARMGLGEMDRTVARAARRRAASHGVAHDSLCATDATRRHAARSGAGAASRAIPFVAAQRGVASAAAR